VTQRDAAVLRPWEEAAQFGVAVAVTTRHGGVSSGPYATLNLGLHVGDDPALVLTNRDRAARAFGVTLNDTVFAEQVHGARATTVTASDRGRGARRMDDAVAATDVLVTITHDVVLVMLVADCVPLALVDPRTRTLAVVHAGWRGTAAGAVGSALEAMAAQGSRPERMTAFLGPAVSLDRYQVGPEVPDGLRGAVAPEVLDPAVLQPDGESHWRVDLVAANRQQLLLGGLAPDRIFDSGTTTADGEHFSDRAARPCGRFALMARLLPR
jgi:polyphenol oxidase